MVTVCLLSSTITAVRLVEPSTQATGVPSGTGVPSASSTVAFTEKLPPRAVEPSTLSNVSVAAPPVTMKLRVKVRFPVVVSVRLYWPVASAAFVAAFTFTSSCRRFWLSRA